MSSAQSYTGVEASDVDLNPAGPPYSPKPISPVFKDALQIPNHSPKQPVPKSNLTSRYQSRRLRYAMTVAWEHRKDRLAMKNYTLRDRSDYSRLGEREIRLLELLPQSGEILRKNVVECFLHQGPRDQLPSYEALSYVWGDFTEADLPILLDGKMFLVKRNLRDALQRFRPPLILPHEENAAKRFQYLWEKIRLLILCPRSGDKNRYISGSIEGLRAVGEQGYTEYQRYFDNIKPTEDPEDPEATNSDSRAGEVNSQSQQLLSLLNIRLRELETLWNIHATSEGKARVVVNSRFLWVDAICINQNDSGERTEQIQLMRQIYQQAASVIIWLGDDDGDGGTAIELLETISRKLELSFRDSGSLIDFDRFLSDPSTPWYSIVFLFSSPWFDRSWTVQEYLASRMGQGSTTFHYGPRCISWRHLSNISKYFLDWDILRRVGDSWFYYPRKYAWHGTVYNLISSGSRTLPISVPVRKSIGPSFLKGMAEWMRLYSMSISSIRAVDTTSLLSWLMWIRNRKATNPRDKIYSILGLLVDINEGGDPNDVQMDALIMDYNASVQDVYSSLVRAIVLKTNSLQVLGACNHRGPLIQRTWTPDWSQDAEFNLFRLDLMIDTNAGEETNGKYWIPFLHQEFQAAAHLPAKAIFADDLSSMSAVGIFWDTIEAKTESQRAEGDDNIDESSVVYELPSTYIPSCYIHKLSEILDLVTKRGAYGGEDITSRAIWRTLMIKWLLNDPSFKQERFEDPDPNLWKQPAREFLNEPDPTGKDSHNMTLERNFQILSINPTTVDDVIDLVRKAVYSAIRFRSTVVVTEKGYVGQAMDRSQVGDIVCVLLGCKFPVVLRPVEDYFEFIGEIYLEGIMYGEAIEAMERGEVNLQTFELH